MTAPHPENRQATPLIADILSALRDHNGLVTLLDGGTDSIREQQPPDNLDDMDTHVLVGLANQQSSPASAVNSDAEYQIQILVRYRDRWLKSTDNPAGTAFAYRVSDEISGVLSSTDAAGGIPTGPQDGLGPTRDQNDDTRQVFDLTFQFNL